MTARFPLVAAALALLLPLAACGPEAADPGATEDAEEAATAAAGTAGAGARPEAEAAGPPADDGETSTAAADGREPVGAEPTGTPMVPAEEEAAEEESAAEEAAAEEAPARVRAVPAGTQIWATFSDSLDSEEAQVDDRFSAEVSSPVTDGSYVLVPTGSRLHGRVTRVRPARGDSAALIAFVFDSVTVREATLPLEATVTDVKLEQRSELKGEKKKIGIGAAAGAVVGAVVGKDVKGALIGAAAGGAAGTAVALGTRARYAVLPAGSEVTLELDGPLEVPLPAEE